MEKVAETKTFNIADFIWDAADDEEFELQRTERRINLLSQYMDELTALEALIVIHGAQTFLRLPIPKDGGHYGSGFFSKRDWIGGLKGENRRVTLRLAQTGTCIKCNSALPAGSTGDHIIPLALGGPLGAQNYLPLCRSCNSSKGKKDLLEWWVASGKPIADLSLDVLCAYVRLMFSWPGLKLDQPASDPLRRAAEGLTRQLPSLDHRLEILKTAKRISAVYLQAEAVR